MLKLTIFRQRKGRRRPKIIQPALANFGAQPGFVVINAFLRTKALERSPMPRQAELAMAVSAVIFHNISGLGRHSRGRQISVSATSVAAFGPLAGLSVSLIRAKAKDAAGSSRSLYIRRYRCGDSITSMEMASIIALPICDMRRDLRNLGNHRRRQRRVPLRRSPWRQHRDQDQHQHQHQHEPDAGVRRAPRNAGIGPSASAGE